MVSNKRAHLPQCVQGDPAPARTLGLPESVIIVIVLTWATVLVVCGMSTSAALELLAGAGLLGIRLARQSGA